MNSSHNSERKYYEKKAQLILKNVLPNFYTGEILIKDHPDLFAESICTGIEVTRASYGDYLEISGLFTQCVNKNIKNIPVKKISQMQSLGATFLIDDNKLIGIIPPAVYSSIVPIKIEFIKKLKKLNNGNYDQFKYYDVFIYPPMFKEYEYNDIVALLRDVKDEQSYYPLKYRHLIICDECKLFLCNIENQEVHSYDFSLDLEHRINVESENYSNIGE